MQKIFHLILIAVCSVSAQAITITAKTCSPSEGKTGSDNYAVLKRVCYSGSRYYFQRRWYSPKFYPLTKGTLYKTSQATRTCGAVLSVMFHGKEVCVSFVYEEHRLIGTTKQSHSRCEQKCFSRSTTILERRYFPAVLYYPDSEFNSHLNLIITPNHYDIQPTAEPCYPTTGETGPLDVAILKRTWCQSTPKLKICHTASYLLFKNVSFMTSQANRTYGRDVSVIFYGKEVCIAYMYEIFSHRISYRKSILDTSYCKKTCFTGYKSNQQEKVDWSDGLVDPILVWKSDYELIVTFDNNGVTKCTKFNFIIVLVSTLTSMLVSFH